MTFQSKENNLPTQNCPRCLILPVRMWQCPRKRLKTQLRPRRSLSPTRMEPVSPEFFEKHQFKRDDQEMYNKDSTVEDLRKMFKPKVSDDLAATLPDTPETQAVGGPPKVCCCCPQDVCSGEAGPQVWGYPWQLWNHLQCSPGEASWPCTRVSEDVIVTLIKEGIRALRTQASLCLRGMRRSLSPHTLESISIRSRATSGARSGAKQGTRETRRQFNHQWNIQHEVYSLQNQI